VARCVTQNVLLYDELTVLEFLEFMAHAYGVPDGETGRAARLIAGNLGLAPLLNSLVGQLSGGERRKVHVAAGFFSGERGPRLLVLDEPANDLDPTARVGLFGVLRDYVQGGGAGSDRSVLISSHNLAELSSLADYVIMLDAGRIRAAASRDELLARMGSGLSYELVLFDEQAKELAGLLGERCALSCREAGPRMVAIDDADAETIRRVVRFLANEGERFRVRELKQQLTALEGIFHFLLGEGAEP
jgi:ABC-type multidrug transport system ATPase subunit